MKLCPKDLILQFKENQGCLVRGQESEGLVIRLEDANKLLRDEMSKWPKIYAYENRREWYNCPMPQHPPSLADLWTRILPPQPIKRETEKEIIHRLEKEVSDLKSRLASVEKGPQRYGVK